MLFIDQIVVTVQLFIGNPAVLLDRRLRLAGLRTVCTVLRTVAAPYICEQLNAHLFPFIFRPEHVSRLNQLWQLLIRQLENRDRLVPRQCMCLIPVFQ